MKTKKHYYYIIAACATLLMFVNVGFPSSAFSAYVPYIVDLPGMSNTASATIITVRNISALIAMALVAIYYKKLDCRIGVFSATLITALGFLIFSFSNDVIMFSIGAFFLGLGYGLGGSSAMTILLGNWFKNKSAIFIGIASAGCSLTGIIVPPLFLDIVNAFSVNIGFMLIAIISILSALLLVLLIVNKPSDIKLKPYGDGEIPESEANQNVDKEEISNRIFKLTKSKYALFILSIFLMGGASLSCLVSLGILFKSSGFDPAIGVMAVSVSSVCILLSKCVSGIMFSKLGTYKGSLVIYWTFVIGIFALSATTGFNNMDIMALGAVAIFGFGFSVATVGISKWSLDLSTSETRKRTVGHFQTAYAAGSLVCGMIPGVMADWIGNYYIFYAFAGIVSIIAVVLFMIIYPKKKCKIEIAF